MKRNTSKIKEFRNAAGRPLILDGAIGSFLQQAGYNDKYLWSSVANISNPELVKNLHNKYLQAGADILTTNTFRTNPIAFKQSGLNYNYKTFIKNSISLASDLKEDKNILIAASNSPAEDCYKDKRELPWEIIKSNHIEHIDRLWESGSVDFILNETFGHLDEIKIVAEYCCKNEIPFVISLFSKDGNTILSGENINDVTEFILEYNPLCISFNCVFPGIYSQIFTQIKSNIPVGFYLNCGSGKFEDEEITCGITAEEYLSKILPFINSNAFFVGSCCGSTPEHTNILRNYFDKQNRN